MIELMLMTMSQGAGFFPNSGPGNKNLMYGDEQLGYFGEVTDGELFSRQELIALTGFTPLLPNTGATGRIWLKFFFKGKVVYIAKMPFASGSTWADIYGAGLVYGTNDNGKYPQGSPVNQFNPILKTDADRTWVLIPRLPTGADTDPAPYNATLIVSMASTLESEMTALFSRVWNGLTGNITEKWARFVNADLTLSNQWYTATQESLSNNTFNHVVVGAADSLYNRAQSGKTSAVHYRPALELIDGANHPITPIPILTFTSSEPREIYMLDYKPPTNDPSITYKVVDAYGVNQTSKDLAVTYSFDSTTPLAVVPGESNSSTSTWAPFTITGEYVA